MPFIGSAVAMDPSGMVAFIGGPNDDKEKGAVWVVVNDGQGVWAQSGLKLTPDDVGSYIAGFGSSISVSDDANTVLIGGPADNSEMGAAWVYVRHDDGSYVQFQPKLVPSDASSSGQFAWSVALSADGNTVLIGAPSACFSLGEAWVYIRPSNGTFSQQTSIPVPFDATGAAGLTSGCAPTQSPTSNGPVPPVKNPPGSTSTTGMIGYTTALSSDGYTALIGGIQDNSNTGAVWVYCRYDNESWIQRGTKITSYDSVGFPQLGSSLAFSSATSTFITGGPSDNSTIGAAWIFEDASMTCPGPPTQSPTASPSSSPSLTPSLSPTSSPTTPAPTTFGAIDKLVGTGTVGQAYMGTSVAISKDGSTVMVGSQYDNSTHGAVWPFERLGNGSWVQQGNKISIAATSVVFFGRSIALSGNGNIALIGAPNEDNSNGSARFYVRLANKTWVAQGNKFQGSDHKGKSATGWAVAMNPSATTAFVGGNFDDSVKGAVWVLKNDGKGNWKQFGSKLTPKGYTGPSVRFGDALAVSDDASLLLVGGGLDNSGTGAAWIFKRLSTGAYVQAQPKLVPNDPPAVPGQFGTSVSLSADGTTALIGAQGEAGGFGAVRVFLKSASGVFVPQTKKLVPSGLIGTAPLLGASMALSVDGYMALVGSPGDDSLVGGVWVFCRYANGSWLQNGGKLLGPDTSSYPQQGSALAYTSSASTFVVGGPGNDGNTGAGWVFGATSTSCPGKPTPSPTVYCSTKCRSACKVARKCPKTCPKSCIPSG